MWNNKRERETRRSTESVGTRGINAPDKHAATWRKERQGGTNGISPRAEA